MKRISFYPTLLVSAVLVAGCSKVQEPTPEEELAAAQEAFDEAKKEWLFVEPLAVKARERGAWRCFARWMSTKHPTVGFSEAGAPDHILDSTYETLVGKATMEEFYKDVTKEGSKWNKILLREQNRELNEIAAHDAQKRLEQAEARLAAAENAVKDAM